MKLNFREILEGFVNDSFPPEEIKELVETTKKERRSICLNCPYNSTQGEIKMTSRCLACGCFIKKKTACLSCNCGIKTKNEQQGTNEPLKWTAVLSDTEESKIKEKIDYQDEKEG